MISILTPGFWGEGLTRTYVLAQALQAEGHEVEVVGCMDRSRAIYPAPPPELPVVPVPLCNFPRLIGRVCRELRGDLVYAVKPYPTSFAIGLCDRLRTRRPLLLDIDDWVPGFLDPRPPADAPTRGPLRAALRALTHPRSDFHHRLAHHLIPRADAITVNTRFLQSRYGGTYVPSGKDLAAFAPARFDAEAVRAKYGLDGYRVVMFPGTVLPHKGLEDLLEAMVALNCPRLRLVVVGGRKDGEPHVRRLLERWGKWIIRLPAQPAWRMPELLAAAHLVAVPQRDTPAARAQFPMKLTDAMAMAKPIVTTRVGDLPEIVGEAAFVVDPGSPAQLAAAIRQVFADYPAAEARGEAARRRALAHYGLPALGSALGPLVEALLRGEHAPRAGAA